MISKFPSLFILVFILASCAFEPDLTPNPGSVEIDAADKDDNAWITPTESYKGMVKGSLIIFQHLNYTTYRLNVANELVEGEMNTERGFMDDPDATVYVLNSDHAESEQAYFVRLSSGDVHMLDEHRMPILNARFTKMLSDR